MLDCAIYLSIPCTRKQVIIVNKRREEKYVRLLSSTNTVDTVITTVTATVTAATTKALYYSIIQEAGAVAGEVFNIVII